MASHISNKNTEKKEEGQRQVYLMTGLTQDGFSVPVNKVLVEVCTTLYIMTCEIKRGKTNILEHKKEPSVGIYQPDKQSKREPKTKLVVEREEFLAHINSFFQYESHYRRHLSDRKYLRSHQNV